MDSKIRPSRSMEEDEALYKSLIQKAKSKFDERSHEEALEYSYVAAKLARNNCFIWADQELEKFLSKIGNDVVGSNKKEQTDNNKSILFVCSFLSDTGGHSEVLQQWVNFLNETEYEIHICVTNVVSNPSKHGGIRTKVGRDVNFHYLNHDEKYVQRIVDLNKTICEINPSRLLMFTNPDDVVAISAIKSLNTKPKTILYNHADHLYWLGVTVADEVIEFRTVGKKVSSMFRDVSSKGVIPLTTEVPQNAPSGPRLNSSGSNTVSISIGSFYKTRGSIGPNYYDTISELLRREPDHHHFFITSAPAGISEELIDEDIKDRFTICGPYEDLSGIYATADFLIETFPIFGGMVRVEAMAHGLPIVAYDCPQFPLFSDSDVLPIDYNFTSSTSRGIILKSRKLIDSQEVRESIGSDLRKFLIDEFSKEKVGQKVRSLVDNTDKWEPEISNKEYMIEDFNQSEYCEFMRSDYCPNKQLLRLKLTKDNNVPSISRLKLYSRAVKNGEFETMLASCGYGIGAVFGKKGDTIARNSYEILNRFR